MDDKTNPGTSPLNELNEPLRQAVEQVRKVPAPADALARALDKARQVTANTSAPRRRTLRWPLYGLAAAIVLIAVGISLDKWGPRARQFAQIEGERKSNSRATAC